MKDFINQHVDGDGNIVAGSGDVQSNSFASHGGTQNVGIGPGAIGCQINNYGSQPAPPPIPRQLPALEPCFLYRYDELAWLNERLHPGKVAAVCGPGGMGKSALAAQAVSKLEPGRFPDGIVFHSFYHQPKVETALQAICEAYKVEAKTSLESTVRQVLSGRQALLILDGTEQADDLPALLRLRGTCGVLITSRKRTDALADRLDLKPLDEQPAAEVFRLYSGVAADDPSVAGICKLLGGWPVALRIAGRYISSTGESAAAYLQWLEQEPFKELAGGQHQEENAALLLRRSVDAVSADARLALGVAGCLAFAPIALEPVIAALGGAAAVQPQGFWARLKAAFSSSRKTLVQYSVEDELRSREALNELVNYGLLEKRRERWQTSHALIHTYARRELPLSKESLKWLAWYYIRFCYEQSQAGIEGYVILDGERAHCLRLIETCLNSKLWQEVKSLTEAIREYLDRQGYWAENIAATSMSLTAAQQSGDLREEGTCLSIRGCMCERGNKCNEALASYVQSLTIAHNLGNRKEQVILLSNIGNVFLQQCFHTEALLFYQQSLTAARKTGNRQGEGVAMNNLGSLCYAQYDYETALQHYEQCLPIWQEIGDKIGEGTTMNNIAEIYRVHGDAAKALEYHEQSLVIAQKLGDRAGEAVTHWNIGCTYIDMGDHVKAEEHISLAVQLKEVIGYSWIETYREGLARVRATTSAWMHRESAPAPGISMLVPVESPCPWSRQQARRMPLSFRAQRGI